MAMALYIDESFPKATGLFGANAGGRGRVRLKQSSDVLASFAAGRVPQAFDALAGTEVPLDHKGPLQLLGADAVWEWGGTNASGYGDPLHRAPERVAHDIASGALDREDAARVYGIALLGDGTVDHEASAQLRRRLRQARLTEAIAPEVLPVALPRNARARPLSPGLALVDIDGELFFASTPGRILLGRAADGYRHGCAVAERPIGELGPEFYARAGRPGDAMVYREYLCPITGTRLEAEIVRRGDPISPDIIWAERVHP
jgi:N-methylhydantoinase B